MRTPLTAVIAGFILAGCTTEPATTPVDSSMLMELPPQPVTDEMRAEESARLNAFFETKYQEAVARSPMQQTYLGIKTDYDKWDDASDVAALEEFAFLEAAFDEMMNGFNYDLLNEDAQLSFQLFAYQFERAQGALPFRHYDYTFNQMFGEQSGIPAFLINQHQISSVSDAEAYIARLEGVDSYLAQHIENAVYSAELGIRPPRFVYDYVISDAQNVLTGYPFSETTDMTDSPLMEDFRKKVDALLDSGEITENEHDTLLERAEKALLSSVGPAYQALIDFQEAELENATTDDGIWKLPDADAYYAVQLAAMTTTDMTADEIHNLGLAEMDRIHDEMRAIMAEVGFEGSLQDFFEFTRLDPQFFYPNTPEGKEDYLTEATAMIDTMRESLPSMFSTFPKADLIVKAVEPFREQSAGKAFYQRPAPDGSRPGTYYANLYDTASMPIYQMEALAYHEGIPGHHMQIAIAQELPDIPKFRRYGGYTAYTEGWGLYSEYFPKEFGFYDDPYSDFGRLAMELWRAARLVVDTGIHDKQWTREQAIDYLMTNPPNPEGDCIKAIERYIVMPGQATAYKIGMLKILELREHARTELGDEFNIAEYHDIVLRQGAVPLATLEALVDAWIADKQAG